MRVAGGVADAAGARRGVAERWVCCPDWLPEPRGALAKARHPWAELRKAFGLQDKEVSLLDQLSKILSHCPGGGAAPLVALVACLLSSNSRQRSRLATGTAAFAGSIGPSFRELVYAILNNGALLMDSPATNSTRGLSRLWRPQPCPILGARGRRLQGLRILRAPKTHWPRLRLRCTLTFRCGVLFFDRRKLNLFRFIPP